MKNFITFGIATRILYESFTHFFKNKRKAGSIRKDFNKTFLRECSCRTTLRPFIQKTS
jgi:hypothetical protein